MALAYTRHSCQSMNEFAHSRSADGPGRLIPLAPSAKAAPS